ncbi:hypothetical protein [Streptomyces aidingensis]|uniref:Phosphatidylserine decarboxylase n=1 Tax=Streptomyces aidingensis TaxID=910347 RepID=A0A1I1ULD4_9ACTN|nr:hypothetical protein [Streptomyces aidingensis]SFD71621.1 phosphatidylserine decarboxylase [Streptomyces aidingensis]
MFHYGGSTHCLLFRPGIQLDFVDRVKNLTPGNVLLNKRIATAQDETAPAAR